MRISATCRKRPPRSRKAITFPSCLPLPEAPSDRWFHRGSQRSNLLPQIAAVGVLPVVSFKDLTTPKPAVRSTEEFMATVTEIPVTLSKDEILRYSRHLIMPEVGMEGQQKLKAAPVLCIGTGGLGSPLALYLAAAGVGTLGLVDFDVVDYTNLQRQIIHSTADVGRKN